jgi:predicted MFS family arabinose efflux permease
LVVGLVGVAQLVPLLGGALWGGTLADAMDRRKVLVGTQLAMAAAVGGLVTNAAMARPALWPLFLCTAVGAGLQGVDWPTRRAALPMIVDETDLTAAIALQTASQQLARRGGAGPRRRPHRHRRAERRLRHRRLHLRRRLRRRRPPPCPCPERRGDADGVAFDDRGPPSPAPPEIVGRHLLDRPQRHDLRDAPCRLPLGTRVFGGGATVIGLLYAAPGAGAFAGSLFTGWCGRVRRQGGAIVACVVVWGVTIALVAVIPVLGVGLALLAVAGAADVISAVFRQAVQQRAVPEQLQGRLSGTFFAVVAGDPRLGDAETGVAAAVGGPRFAVWSGGLACVVGAFVLLWRAPELRRDRGGGQALGLDTMSDALAEVTTELGEAEPL